MAATTVPGYEHRAIGLAYDVLNRLLWLPHGSARLRRALIRAMDLGPGHAVLELGCGTGLATQYLVRTGAAVTAVDGANTMLRRARRRAPDARFEHRDLSSGVSGGPFDAIFLSFVLHELAPSMRARLLRECVAQLAPTGTIAILEWGLPNGSMRARAWRRAVRAIEPAVAHDVLDGALEQTLEDVGLTVTTRSAPAGGRAQILLVSLLERRT